MVWEQTRDNTVFIWCHFHWSYTLLYGLLISLISEVRDALAGSSLCSALGFAGIAEEGKLPISRLAMVVSLSLWCSSQSAVGNRDNRTPASGSMTDQWIPELSNSCSHCQKLGSLSVQPWPVLPFVPELQRGRSSTQLEAVASISRTRRLVHHSLIFSPSVNICLFLLFVLTLKEGSGNLGGYYILDSLITTHIVNRLKHCFFSFDICTYWPKKTEMC